MSLKRIFKGGKQLKSKQYQKDWRSQLKEFVVPFLEALGHVAQRDWAPIYLQGLLSRSPRKSATALGAEVAPGEEEQLHHFVCSSPWPAAKLQAVLAVKAQQWVGGPESHLIVDDTALVKQGRCSVGVAYQYGGELGKRANCQCLVTLSLAQEEVPVPLALRLYLRRGPGVRISRGAASAGCPKRSSTGPSGRLPWKRSTGSERLA
jgi:SRSO17 transposase